MMRQQKDREKQLSALSRNEKRAMSTLKPVGFGTKIKMFDPNEEQRIKVRQNVKNKIIEMLEIENQRARRPKT